MTLIPRSLFGRLLASATLFIMIALVVAGLSIGRVLERFVLRGLDERLDSQIVLLARAVHPDGTIDRPLIIDMPPFDQPGRKWAWQVKTPAETLRSASLQGAAMPEPVLRRTERRRSHAIIASRPADGIAKSGEAMHFRIAQIDTSAGPVTIMAAGPREVAERPLRQAAVPLLASLGILGVFLIGAIFLQLRFGLRPLQRIEQSLAAVRRGEARHVPSGQPVELKPLVDEVNALIDQNEAGLENARRHVANLAHGLKTPLAALAVKLDEDGGRDSEMRALIDRIDASIRHHLGRARAAAPGGPARQATLLAPHIADLTTTLARIHAGRTLSIAQDVDPALAVACDPQDLEEMLGNLLDNAWRWAKAAIRITAIRSGSLVEIAIADDGPGLSTEAMAEAVVAGRRLDERGAGHGFGLSITRELAELYGGTLLLGPSPSGGLLATLALPRPEAHA